jgi:alkanesulfonate monooxygenase SsuD/methylene tetrahydromethanopterin reductase-like flavin-dependent oxidoreductase (luciferase family)
MTVTGSVGLLLGSSSPPELVPRLARRAEQLGFAELWLSEDYFTTGGIAATTAALANTSTIPVATGIVSAMARHPAVLAMEASTIARLYPGRFRLGVGLGVPEWLKQMGTNPRSPLSAMRESLTALRSLLAGETVSLDGRVFSFDGITLEHPPSEPPPIVAAATAPKMLALSGELADGTVLSVLSSPAYVRWAREQIAVGLSRADRNREHRVTTFAFCNVNRDGAKARAEIRPLATLYLTLDPKGPLTDVYGITAELVDLIEQAGGDPGKSAEAVPDPWLEDLVVAGDPTECVGKIRALLEAGSDSVALFPTPVDHGEQIIELLAREVIPALKNA